MSQYPSARRYAASGAMVTPQDRATQQPPTEGEGPTYDELYEEARKRGLKGRSKMSKTELERALAL
jgi:hypothetical protein